LTIPEVDVVAFPFSPSGEADLTRDYIQSGYQCLKIGGRMFAAIDNPRDKWLDEQLQRVFRRVERREQRKGIIYIGSKAGPLKKVKNYSCEFAFRDRGRLIRVFSRPGVFSHRHIDPGARHLIEVMPVAEGARVIDIGCGAGAVALAAAFRAENVTVHAIDSNARAVECTLRGAALNGLTNLTSELNSNGAFQGIGNYDLALANPPYYANFGIARHFMDVGRTALRAGGRVLVVTKLPEWYQTNMPQWFDAVTMIERKGYFVFQGVRPVA
jgi:16S rRNA (guanine1207-N2)-methyltransferase